MRQTTLMATMPAGTTCRCVRPKMIKLNPLTGVGGFGAGTDIYCISIEGKEVAVFLNIAT